MNLDHLAAEVAKDIIIGFAAPGTVGREKVETLVNKTLGVVQESGPTAVVLYLNSRSAKEEKTVAKVLRRELLREVRTVYGTTDPGQGALPELEYVIENVTKDLDRVLLVRRIWEHTLIYARYLAKGAL